MHRAVLLLHTLGDGSTHYDWLIDQPERTIEHRVICFRCNIRPDHPWGAAAEGGGRFEGIRLADHRVRYLTYQGAISGNRGSVSRIARGVVHGLILGERSVELTIEWGESTVRYRGRLDARGGDAWIFERDGGDSLLDGGTKIW